MNTDEGKISFRVELDNTRLKRQIEDSREQFRNLGNQVTGDVREMDNALAGLGGTIASLGAAYSMQEFARKVMEVRGEFQQLEVAFETMLQSKSKADALMAQMVKTAAITPFGLQDVAGGAKQLLAYGVAAEDVNDTLIRLGDIAAGLSIPLGDLVMLYGTTVVQGRMFTQDLRQFMGRGIPITKELAEVMGVAENKVGDLVTAGEVGSEQFIQAIRNMTDEGSQFGGLMEKQSHTITGKISNIEDAFDVMFNEIGERSEGFINGALDSVGWLVEHYESVGTALMSLVAAYGVYKAALMATTAFTNSAYTYEATQLQTLLASKQAAMDADLAEAVSKGRLTESRAVEVQALRMELEAKIQDLAISAEAARVEAEHAMQKRMAAQVVVEGIQAEILAKEEEIAAVEAYGFAQTAEGLRDEKNILTKKLNTAQTKLNMASKMEGVKAERSAAAAQALSTMQTQKDTLQKQLNTTQTKILTGANLALKKALDTVKAAWATNPLGLILMGATLAMGALMTLDSAMETTSAEMERFGESAVKSSRNVDTLVAVIENTSAKSKVHKGAVDELSKIYEDYGITLSGTIDRTEELIRLKDILIGKIREEGEETQKANMIASFEKAMEASADKMQEKVKEMVGKYGTFGHDIASGLVQWDAGDNEGLVKVSDAMNKLKENSEQVSIIISGIVQSSDNEQEALAGIAKALSETYDIPIEVFKNWNGDFLESIRNFQSETDALRAQQSDLAGSLKDSSSASDGLAQSVDYTKMEFEDLFDAAYTTKDKIDEVDGSTASPKIDKSSIDNANGALAALINSLNGLIGSNFQLPKIDIYKIPGVGDFFRYTQKKAEEKTQKDAKTELDKRVAEAMKTREKTKELLKEVDGKLEKAITGSTEEKELLAVKKKLETQKKTFDKMEGKGGSKSGSKGSKGKSAEEIAADVEKAQIRTAELIEKSQREREEMVHNFEMERLKNDIELEADAAEKRRKQLEYDHQAQKDQLDDNLRRDIESEISRQKALFEAKEAEKKAANSKYVKKNFSDEDIDQAKLDEIRERYAALEEDMAKIQQKAKADLLRSDIDDLRAYLQNYGDYQQQKLAIASEYAQKISKAQSEGERLSLERERDSKIAGLRATQLRETIDWSGVFGEFGGIFKDYLTPILKEAKEYTKTDEFKTSDQASQKAMYEAISQMETALGSADKVSFEKLGDDIQRYQAAQGNLRAAQETYAARYAEWQSAADAYARAIQEGTEEERKIAKERADAATKSMLAADTQVQSMQSVATEAQNTVSQTAKALKTSMDGVLQGMRGLASGGISSAYEGLVTMGKSMKALEGAGKLGDAFGKLSEKMDNVPIIGWVVSIIDIFKDGIGEVISGLIDAVFSAVTGILDDMLNLKDGMLRKVGESLLSGITGLLKSALTLGGMFDWIGGGESDKNYEKDMERLSATNEALQKAIEHLSDILEDSAVKDADEIAERQIELLKESEKNTQEELRRSGAASKSGMGGHHSSNYKINKGMKVEDWERISRAVGKSVTSASEFWGLSSEEMRKVFDEAPDLFAKIKALADDGYQDAAQWMDTYIDYCEQLKELEEARKEKLTSYSFDNLRDEFKSALTDMESSAADFAESFNEMLVNSIAESLMSEKYDPLIKELYNKWADYMEDGALTDAELADIQRDREAIYNAMQGDREFLKSLSGGTSQGQGSSGGFATASQDSIDELNGRFTAIQMDTSIIRETLTGIGVSIASMNLSANEVRDTMNEIRNISLLAIDHLEAISKNTHELYEMNERLGKIEKNTRNL